MESQSAGMKISKHHYSEGMRETWFLLVLKPNIRVEYVQERHKASRELASSLQSEPILLHRLIDRLETLDN